MSRLRAIATRITAITILGVLVFAGTGFGCKGQSEAVREASKPITLTWWRVFDGEDAVRPIIEAYNALHPNVTIVYRKFRYEEYETALLNALAEDRGPDIVSIHNTEIRRYQSKLLPMPRQVTLPYQITQGGLKKEVVTVLKTTSLPSIREIKNSFADVVASDVVTPADPTNPTAGEAIYGLPMGIDTLALYVNRDLLNLAGVPQVPVTWSEFREASKKITRLGDGNVVLQAGAALGTSKNVERAADILGLLMMQNGAEMLDSSGMRATFDQTPAGLTQRPVPPGEEALTFYTDFANVAKESYTWNSTMQGSLDAFVNNKAAFMLGYSYHLPLIKARAPRLNLEIAPAPQIEGNPRVNFANYFVESVSKKSKNPDVAWDFVNFATTPKQASVFLDATRRAPAIRSLIAARSEDPDTGVFTAQVLTAKSWYKGKDTSAVEAAFGEMIESALKGETELRDILRLGAAKVNQTLQ